MEKYQQGQIKWFPMDVVYKMLDNQCLQGNKRDVKVFERNARADVEEGGFLWSSSKEGYDYWKEVMGFLCPQTDKATSKGKSNPMERLQDGEYVEIDIKASPGNTSTPGVSNEIVTHYWVEVDSYHMDLEDEPFLGAIFDDSGRMKYSSLCQIQDETLQVWDSDKKKFVIGGMYIDDITHVAAAPELLRYPVKTEVESIVRGWCERQHQEIPETDEQTLVASVIDWYKKRSNMT